MVVKSKPPYKTYIVLFCVLAILVNSYTFPDALDIVRYYEEAEIKSNSYSLREYIDYHSLQHVDFIYFTTLFLSFKYGIGGNIVTLFFMFLYYWSILECIRIISLRIKLHHIPNYILLYVCLCAPFIWVQSISRNLAAISIFYFGFLQFLKNRRLLGVLALLASVFTHFSMLAYVAILGLSFVLQRVKISKAIIVLILILMTLLVIITPTYLNELFSYIAGNTEIGHYSTYANQGLSPAITSSYIGYGDKLPMIYTLVFSIFVVLHSKREGVFFWLLMIFVGLLLFAMFSNAMLTQRFMMLVPLFVGLNICYCIKYGTRNICNLLIFQSIIGLVTVLLHFYAYRLNFSLI